MHVYRDRSSEIFWVPKSLQTVTAAMKLKDAPWKESYDTPRQCIKKAETSLGRQKSVWSKLWFCQWSRTDVRAGPQ